MLSKKILESLTYMQQVVGLVGYIASGKSTVSEHFIDRDFKYFKLSDAIRRECEKQGLEINRVNLQNVGNQLREQYSGSVLAQKTLEASKAEKLVIIDD